MTQHYLGLIFLFLFSWQLSAQCPDLDEAAISRLRNHVEFLADDKLAGRAPGSEGAEMAAAYIIEQFEKNGIEGISGSYRQTFTVPVQAEFPPSENSLNINDAKASVQDEYFPVKWSADGDFSGQAVYAGYGIVAPELEHNDYEGIDNLSGKAVVIDVSSPDGVHPHSAYLQYHDLGERINLAIAKGADAVILVNLEGSASDLQRGFKKRRDKGVPVVFITDNDKAETLKNGGTIDVSVAINEKQVEAHNILGSIDNGAEETIAIGAHYDHLGMGGQSSLYRGEPEIHNGADDNASGVAAILELARQLKSDAYADFNYHFIAFSAEEMGLLGSDHFVDELETDYKYMLNFDMVGRLEDSVLAVNGAGTAAAWPQLLESAKCAELMIKSTKSGIGPSDHTNFYYQDIPVLHFFTGTHTDYHKPSDDADKINYQGIAAVVRYNLAIIAASNEGNFDFVETPSENTKAPRFSVTLGVMPDYLYEGEGMRIDGVTSDKPADKAGLKQGDVVKYLGKVKVVDMMSYMKALGQFKAGDTAELKYQRGKETLSTTVQF